MDSLKPYLERLKYTNPTTDTYLYSTKTNVAINEQGKIDSSGISHHILNQNGISPTNISQTKKINTFDLLTTNNSGDNPIKIISSENNLMFFGETITGELYLSKFDNDSPIVSGSPLIDTTNPNLKSTIMLSDNTSSIYFLGNNIVQQNIDDLKIKDFNNNILCTKTLCSSKERCFHIDDNYIYTVDCSISENVSNSGDENYKSIIFYKYNR